MSINATTQSYMQDIRVQNIIDTVIAVFSLSSPFTISDLRDYVNADSKNSILNTNNYLENGKNAILYDENDDYSVTTVTLCLGAYLNIDISDLNNLIDQFNLKTKNNFKTISDVRSNFYNNILFTNDSALVKYGELAQSRIKIWNKYLTQFENDPTQLDFNVDSIIHLEKSAISEYNVISVNYNIGVGEENLNYIFHKVLFADSTYWSPGEVDAEKLRAIGGRYLNRTQENSYFRLFDKVADASLLSHANLKSLITRMEDVGFFRLASYAYEISQFAKRRAYNQSTIQKSASEYVDENVDTAWLLLLGQVTNAIRKDPIFFQSVIYYFPTLTTFLLDAISVSTDYSNGGLGGGSEDAVNDPNAFIDSLEKAFGIGNNGQQIFTLAYKLNNTSLRIKDVLAKSPFRPNTAPQSPDIFHLRLGASNFYVPPISININTSFKAGSLMASALRQKNSPKFNSGYKDTTINLQLFFPNYEEIWGISIDDASQINLNEDFKINFKNGGTSDAKIDKFLSSLRGLIAAFKYTPFVPVKNHYLNAIHGITAVGFSSMTIATVPNFPFALVVNLELVNFNHKPFLPMISDFNQAIHWGKYRQYLGKAAGQLNRYVNEKFLLKTSDVKGVSSQNPNNANTYTLSNGQTIVQGTVVLDSSGEYRPVEALDPGTMYTVKGADGISGTGIAPAKEDQDILSTNIIDQWMDGNSITLYAPAESQTKLFLPSTASFRTDQEKMMTDLGQNSWESLLKTIGIDIDQSNSYGIPLANATDISKNNAYSKSTRALIKDMVDLMTAGVNSSDNQTQIYSFLVEDFIKTNSNLKDPEKAWLRNKTSDETSYPSTDGLYTFHGQFLNGVSLNSIKTGFKQMAKNPKNYLDQIVDMKKKDYVYRTGKSPDDQKIHEEVAKAFSVTVYERFFQSGPIQSLMEAARARAGAYQFNEWEVPMIRVDLDPNSVIVNGVTVSLGNNLTKMQLQMQDEPTFQHIGGKDSFVNMSLTIIGENELIKIRKVFEHISGLARLEHASGVIGFLGIKNIITALAGIKYVMPLTYNVNTKQGFPHVYDVELTFTDFDIFQQKREQLSNKQQKDFIEEFGAKRNPFLRIKQLWGAFNAYPDFPLEVKDSNGEVAGCLDPDFYFRSFEMFDKDVINHMGPQTKRVEDYAFDNSSSSFNIGQVASITNDILNFLRKYDSTIPNDQNPVLQDMVDYIKQNNISRDQFLSIFYTILNSDTNEFKRDAKYTLMTNFIQFDNTVSESNPYVFSEKAPAAFQVGNMSPNQADAVAAVDAALAGKYNEAHYDEKTQKIEIDPEVSFHPDEVDFHFQIYSIPAVDFKKSNKNRIPSMLQTAAGVHFGYVDKSNGRFYLTVNGENVKINTDGTTSFNSNKIVDTQTPDRGTTNVMTGVNGAQPLSSYQKPYKENEYKHWETMLVDTSYRDISGRMLRAFPTYMLWLIDEGGYFAGAKLFDNFYGLQSIIDFSVVSSEDLLGDTLIFRVSNLYSKLTKKSANELFSTLANDGFNYDLLSLTEGISNIIDKLLNTSRNILSGMSNEYVVDINNIRLKPGVRVHLRAGYGSNPNSLQTIFNGVITTVEQGEIVTVTAQSDAIELGAVVNSTKKNQDSGKIDGGINTGLYMSEPRDLMVRLLSMGSSRVKEAFAHATRGTVFSENKFGIRHFGTILYEPLNDEEKAKNDAIRNSVSNAFTSLGNGNVGSVIGGAAWGGVQAIGGAAVGAFNTTVNNTVGIGFSSNIRTNALNMMGTLWANYSSDVDLEIFKRNIYPGNGLGIAQFMGGDIDDGWSTAASLVPDEKYNERVDGYLGRLTDLTYNRLLTKYQDQSNTGAHNAVDSLTSGNKLNKDEGVNKPLLFALGGAATFAGAAIATPIGGAFAGATLLGVLGGRGGENVFRTMGLLSANADDDLPGFDEVSFRAQTYMRTVWDLFQVCARLLPNYIVAVRPFEDRSTVFYGKPHWLYTSGVVPVTTGYPGDKKASELGIIPPKHISPNQQLNQIMETINKDTNPLSDYAAYFQAFEPSEAFKQISQDINTSTGIYSPTDHFSGKILNFYSDASTAYRKVSNADTPNGIETKVIAKLPTSKGFVDIGPHLPIIPKNQITDKGYTKYGEWATEGNIQHQAQIHKQISNLLPRYSFPYFTINENIKLKNTSTIRVPSSWAIQRVSSQIDTSSTPIEQVIKLEETLFKDNKYTLMPSNGDQTSSGTINLDIPLNLTSWLTQIEGAVGINTTKIIMPLPQIALHDFGNGETGTIQPQNAIDQSYSFEYAIGSYNKITYKEWGAPETPEDEQFYIAMQWPYEPDVISTDGTSEVLAKFKETYGISDFYGKAQDYKDRKVLVYNPDNGRAVVCRPAYFMWGKNESHKYIYENSETNGAVSAIVSPDAAYYLSIITFNEKNAKSYFDDDVAASAGATTHDNLQKLMNLNTVVDNGVTGNSILYKEAAAGYRSAPVVQECFFAFVPDDIPVGVIAQSINPISKFTLEGTTSQSNSSSTVNDYIIGFGKFTATDNQYKALELGVGPLTISNSLAQYKVGTNVTDATSLNGAQYGGNVLEIESGKSFFDLVLNKDYAKLSADELNNIRNSQKSEAGKRVSFTSVYDVSDAIGVQARAYYDEKFDPNTSVIVGSGRSNHDAQEIWDTFRAEYHNSESVKNIFFDIFGLNADNEEEFPPTFKTMLTGLSGSAGVQGPLNYFSATGNSAADEFSILLGSDFIAQSEKGTTTDPISTGMNANGSPDYAKAIEFMRSNFIDAQGNDQGLIDYYNNIIVDRFKKIYDSFFNNSDVNGLLGFSIDAAKGQNLSTTGYNRQQQALIDSITTPKQLFLLMVGIFRQRLWEDPFARAWLVLKPDKKPGWTGYNGWSFKPVDKIFRAFIDPNNDYAKPNKKTKFLQLLSASKGQGNDNSTWLAEAVGDVEGLVKSTIGPIVTGISDALSGLLSMFKLSMQQLGYALSESGNFKKQANILNKALNDSIYYSLGRPGTILRATDNPFTREYGEPVIEIREPFQRIHFISSFSHIISNQIQENINGVATSITAISDGKYPVTVALDKGAPAEKQVEKTVETGILFDNVTGSGFTFFLHPFMHPLETFRGIAKNLQGTPDELSARRVALSHLKESIKDIYGGELIVVGNADIRPHDLVYLSDVYERMYGIFEVEQVVHHFTPEMGYITSITPNALVTVNDPARWFQTAWMQSWMHVQSIRNDTRGYIDNIRGANSGLSFGGNVSIDKLGEILSGQMIGGFQFTHGSSALVKDVMANQMATTATVNGYKSMNNEGDGMGGAPMFALIANASGIGHFIWKGWEWVRDNVLDQHGCYVQYLNKNGQPMDAGLSYNQGMVVGQHHSVSLLPGILGVRTKTRTPEGNSYIRTDDLLKSLGWNETDISDLSRHVSYEASLAHAQVLNLSGIGPEKAGFEWQFRIIAKVTRVIDGDTFVVEDVLSGNSFTVRFDAINAAETNVIQGQLNPNLAGELLDVSTSGGQAKLFVRNAVDQKMIILRVNQTRTKGSTKVGKAVLESDFEAGSILNNKDNYELDIFGNQQRATDSSISGSRVLGTVFYKTHLESKNTQIQYIKTLYRNNLNNLNNIKTLVKNDIYDKSPFYTNFEKIYSAIEGIINLEYFDITSTSDPIYLLSNNDKLVYSRLIYFKIMQEIYDAASNWPRISWDEYYPDGTPVTLNWELVVNNLARVFVDNLQKEGQAVQTSAESTTSLKMIGI